MDASSPAQETQHDCKTSLNSLLPTLRLLSPSNRPGEIVESKHLRDVCLQGSMEKLPKWARSQAWKVLLGYLPSDKSQWPSTLDKHRNEYYRFLVEFSSRAHHGAVADQAESKLVQIFRCIKPFSQKIPSVLQPYTESWTDETLGLSDTQRLYASTRHALLQRLAKICPDYEEANDLLEFSQARVSESPSDASSSLANISAASAPKARRRPTDAMYIDRQWHIMLRILYLYAMMNPCVGNIQGLVNILYVFLGVVCDSRDASIHGMKGWEATVLGVNSASASEADTFWCFSLLVGEFREVFDFGGVNLDASHNLQPYLSSPVPVPFFHSKSGIATALRHCSTELRCNDEVLWLYLCKHSLDPQTAIYTLRWIACLFSADLPLRMVAQLWDVLLTERYVATDANGSVNALVDMCCAMLLAVRDQLLNIPQQIVSNANESVTTSEVYQRSLELLQSYPMTNPRPIISLTLQMRERFRENIESSGQALGSPHPMVARARAVSDTQTRSSKLQARLAATVQRGLATPSQRAVSWDYQNVPDTAAKDQETKAGAENLQESHGLLASPNRKEPPSLYGSGQRISEARHLLRKYTDALQDSDAVASVSKASTNLAAKALSWRTVTPKKQEPRAHECTLGVPDLPIPTVLNHLEERDLSRTTHSFTYPPLESGSLSMSSNEADTSSSLILPSLESTTTMTYPQQDSLLSPFPSLSTHSQDALSPSKPGSGLRRSRPLPPRKDDLFATKSQSSSNMSSQSRSQHTDTELSGSLSHTSTPPGTSSQAHLDALMSDLRASTWIKDS